MAARTTPVVLSFARTPIAKFRSSFAPLTAPQLGAHAIKSALSHLSSSSDLTISEAYMGNVVSAGIGQAPARQAVLGAGLPPSTVCTTVNKVCASGMKSVMLACQTVALGRAGSDAGSIIAGGMESMTNIPHYLPNGRSGTALGHARVLDGVIHDGLWDVYNDQHMGMCAEKCATDYNISRDDQDAYAVESYNRARDAQARGYFDEEIAPVSIPQRRGDDVVVSADEEPTGVDLDKLPKLRPAFLKDGGTVTAANASSLNDGAAAMIVSSEECASERGVTPLFRIRGYGDAEQAPEDFTTTPSLAVPVALENAGMTLDDVDYHEINEAFSVVAIANMMRLGLDHDKVNVFGGAVAIGHPIGMSGARIIGTLYNVLKRKGGAIGCASICNGGGGASAIIIERLS
mmetsp:Transcript_50150/g.60527  ORF Transcript_50150/g.60527 Transcript_50150/m.60527 type:complete len:403 (-) Transcript_50150:80-1288(-)